MKIDIDELHLYFDRKGRYRAAIEVDGEKCYLDLPFIEMLFDEKIPMQFHTVDSIKDIDDDFESDSESNDKDIGGYI